MCVCVQERAAACSPSPPRARSLLPLELFLGKIVLNPSSCAGFFLAGVGGGGGLVGDDGGSDGGTAS